MEKYKRGLEAGTKNLKIHYSDGDVTTSKKTKSETHGGFDNDVTTMNSILHRILGKTPDTPFTEKSLKY